MKKTSLALWLFLAGIITFFALAYRSLNNVFASEMGWEADSLEDDPFDDLF